MNEPEKWEMHLLKFKLHVLVFILFSNTGNLVLFIIYNSSACTMKLGLQKKKVKTKKSKSKLNEICK